MFEKIIFGIAILQVVWAAAETCTVATSDPESKKCKQDKCDVWIGGSNFCSQCSTAAEHLVNGKCITTGEDAEGACTTKNDGTCTSCKAGFFLHRGGCYKIGTEPGNLICEDTQASQTQGVCEACSPGYFKNPTESLDKTKESCIACNQTTAIDENKGVQNCATCTIENPAGALRLGKTATCKTCFEGFFVASGGTACTACNDDNCATCVGAGNSKCTRCKLKSAGGNDKEYLKVTDASSNSGECVDTAGCPATHYVDEEAKECNTCVSGGTVDCTTCEKGANGVVCKTCTTGKKTIFGLNRKSCVASCPANSTPKATGQGSQMCECNEGLQPNTESTECQPISNCNTEHCLECTGEGADKEVCTKCLSEYYLTPTSQCVSDCTTLKGYYGNDTDRKCKKCNDACIECKGEGADKCTACPAGRMLQYTDADTPANGGTCMNQCSVSPANDGCAECGAQIGGTAYCSKCKNTQQAPLDGNCAANTRTRFCTTVSNGACTQCENNYFLKDGGCYQTDRQPGKQVCTTVQGGKCTKCASGLTADNGDCSNKRCHLSCETCTAANDANACATCSTGYYKPQSAGTKCNPCSEGLAGCRQCTVSSTGAFMCLEMGDGTGDNTGGSVNRGGLSTGAIAGISVAVVAVVGGLVGFLCWWFLCRGKA
ncbi:VSP [Giardia duodenalis]|uniref:VSP n=1 Tax=Giardia intestinalis (strain ATCC 50803 / WB clone C6) TaxID=184922 RepID=A0A644F5M7_GIAIC|nr:VSP [Giardia intestinalis]KAE8303702.1 VSP [Giardia intestinalis]